MRTSPRAAPATTPFRLGDSYGYAGRNIDVTVSIRMEWLTRQDTYETVTHEHVSRPLDFAITTAVWQPSHRDIVSGGATVEPLTQLISYAPGWDEEKVSALLSLAPYHLSAMQAGCAHQEVVYERDGRPSLDETEPCPLTGYKYGHAWLVEELPDGFLETVEELFA